MHHGWQPAVFFIKSSAEQIVSGRLKPSQKRLCVAELLTAVGFVLVLDDKVQQRRHAQHELNHSVYEATISLVGDASVVCNTA